VALGACSKGEQQETVGTTHEALSATDTDDVRAAVLDAFCYCESFVPSFRRFTEGAAECAGDEWLAEYVEEHTSGGIRRKCTELARAPRGLVNWQESADNA
jgi:hypothetical protein